MVFDSIGRWSGQLREFLRPMSEFMEGAWEDGARGGVAWLMPILEQQNSGFADASDIYDRPVAWVP